jgi:hypothetical protein
VVCSFRARPNRARARRCIPHHGIPDCEIVYLRALSWRAMSAKLAAWVLTRSACRRRQQRQRLSAPDRSAQRAAPPTLSAASATTRARFSSICRPPRVNTRPPPLQMFGRVHLLIASVLPARQPRLVILPSAGGGVAARALARLGGGGGLARRERFGRRQLARGSRAGGGDRVGGHWCAPRPSVAGSARGGAGGLTRPLRTVVQQVGAAVAERAE